MKKLFGAGVLVLALAGCSYTPTPTWFESYDGKGTVTKTYQISRKRGCEITVKLANGQSVAYEVGRRTKCQDWKPGRVVSFNDGRLVG